MALQNFKQQIEEINEEIRDAYSQDEYVPIYDGALNPEGYYASELKILWLMKEPYDNGGIGDYSLPDLFTKEYEKFYKDLILKIPSWRTVVHTCYCIFKNCSNYDAKEKIKKKPEMANCLNKIAWVNIQKLPSKNGKRTDKRDIHAAYQKHRDILNKQIDEVLKPHIIICGNTFPIIKDSLVNLQRKSHKDSYWEYFETKKRVYINAYHPSQSTVTREKYVNGITLIVKDYLLNQDV